MFIRIHNSNKKYRKPSPIKQNMFVQTYNVEEVTTWETIKQNVTHKYIDGYDCKNNKYTLKNNSQIQEDTYLPHFLKLSNNNKDGKCEWNRGKCGNTIYKKYKNNKLIEEHTKNTEYIDNISVLHDTIQKFYFKNCVTMSGIKITFFEQTLQVHKEEYYTNPQNGNVNMVLHRYNGPAVVKYYYNGKKMQEMYYINGESTDTIYSTSKDVDENYYRGKILCFDQHGKFIHYGTEDCKHTSNLPYNDIVKCFLQCNHFKYQPPINKNVVGKYQLIIGGENAINFQQEEKYFPQRVSIKEIKKNIYQVKLEWTPGKNDNICSEEYIHYHPAPAMHSAIWRADTIIQRNEISPDGSITEKKFKYDDNYNRIDHPPGYSVLSALVRGGPICSDSY